MSIYERFTGFARDVRNVSLGAAALAYMPAFEAPGTSLEAELASVSAAFLVTAVGMRVLECCARQLDEQSTADSG